MTTLPVSIRRRASAAAASMAAVGVMACLNPQPLPPLPPEPSPSEPSPSEPSPSEPSPSDHDVAPDASTAAVADGGAIQNSPEAGTGSSDATLDADSIGAEASDGADAAPANAPMDASRGANDDANVGAY